MSFGELLRSYAPTRVDRAYLEAWCLRRAPKAPASIGQQALSVVAEQIADNLRDAALLERLAAFDAEAWDHVLRLIRAVVGNTSETLVAASLEEVASELVATMTPAQAFQSAEDREKLEDTRGYLFVSPLDDWIQLLAVRAQVDREIRFAAPGQETILRDRGRTALRALLAQIARLPARRRLALTLAMWRGEEELSVTETLLDIADDLVADPDEPLARREDLFPLDVHESLTSDDEIADWLFGRFGKEVSAQTVRANRSLARTKLGEDPTNAHLLNSLLRHRSTRPAGDQADGDDVFNSLLERAVRSGSLRLFELLVEEDCPRFTPTLPLYVEATRPRAAGTKRRDSVPDPRVWRDLRHHLNRCVRCRKTTERLGDMPLPEPSELRSPARSPDFMRRPLDGLVQGTVAQLLGRPDLKPLVKTRLVESLKLQPELDGVAMVAVQARLTAPDEVEEVSKAAWDMLKKHARVTRDTSAVSGHGAGVAVRAEPSRGAGAMVLLEGNGVSGRFAHVGGSLIVSLHGLPRHLERRHVRIEAMSRAGTKAATVESLDPPAGGSISAVRPDDEISLPILRNIGEIYVLPITADIPDIRDVAEELTVKSEAARASGALYEALAYSHQALLLWEKLLSHEATVELYAEKASALLQAGRIYTALCYPQAAQAVLVSARDIAVRENLVLLQSDTHHRQAELRRDQGKWRRARLHFDRALKLIDQEAGTGQRKASLLVDRAHVRVAVGDAEGALEDASEAMELFKDDAFGRAAAEHVRALAQRMLGHFDAALAAAERASRELRESEGVGPLRTAAERNRLEGEIACTQGKAYHSIGMFDEALDHFRLSLQHMYACGSRTGEAEALGARGRTYEALGQDDRALRTYNRVLQLFEAIGDLKGEGKMLSAKARLLLERVERGAGNERVRDLDEARAAALRAVDLRERDLRGKAASLRVLGRIDRRRAEEQTSDRARSELRRRARRTFEKARRLQEDAGDERGLAHTLSDLATVCDDGEEIGLFSKALQLHKDTKDLQGEILTHARFGSRLGDRKHYLLAVDGIERMRARLAGPEVRASYLATRAYVYQEAARLLASQSRETCLSVLEAGRSRSLLERIAASGGGRTVEPISFDPLHAGDFDASELQSVLSPTSVALVYFAGDVYVVTDKTVQVRELTEDESTIAAWVSDLRDSLLAGDLDVALADSLARVLVVEPARLAVQERRSVLISLDDALHQLPLGVLTTRVAGAGDPVLSGQDVWVVPSLAVARALRKSKAERGEASVDMLAVAPEADSEKSTAASEVTRLSRVMESAGLQAPHVLAGRAATLDDVRKSLDELGHIRFLHFAADSDQAWGPDGPAAPADLLLANDHAWTAAAIAESEIRADVVALSADNAALGPVQRGEGSLSLARAFLAAGATCVCASTLPVVGDSAQHFFEAFYTRLLAGDNPATALRGAQRALAEREVDPLHWAGWQIIGAG
jgi:CHAT domain-containing protein/tetratricopeptide (TPR) repeat protein